MKLPPTRILYLALAIVCLVTAWLLQGSGARRRAVRALEARKPALALRILDRNPRSADSSFELLRAEAALAAGDLRQAEISAELSALYGGQRLRGTRDFLLGIAAFERATRAEREARSREADPTALPRAEGAVREAIVSFERAEATRQGNWPAARYNKERAEELRTRIEALAAQKREEAKKRKKKEREEGKGNETEEEEGKSGAQREPRTLTRSELLALFAKLEEKHREKRILRAKLLRKRSKGEEKAW